MVAILPQWKFSYLTVTIRYLIYNYYEITWNNYIHNDVESIQLRKKDIKQVLDPITYKEWIRENNKISIYNNQKYYLHTLNISSIYLQNVDDLIIVSYVTLYVRCCQCRQMWIY